MDLELAADSFLIVPALLLADALRRLNKEFKANPGFV
jgi:hypothetical protein